MAVNSVYCCSSQNQYFSIALDNGHVVFTVQFDPQTRLVMKSSKQLNNNIDMIQIQAIVQNKDQGNHCIFSSLAVSFP